MNSIFPVWKPIGITSYDVIRQVKKGAPNVKIGHCGTLDPFAEGLLIVVTGSETSNSDRYMNSLKTYKAVIRLGLESDTLDSTGLVL